MYSAALMALAHDMFSAVMVALFILLFSRGALVFVRAVLRIALKKNVYAAKGVSIVGKFLPILVPMVTIFTSLVCIGVLTVTIISRSLATAFEFYIVYVALQFCFTFFMVAFERLPARMLLEPFVEIFYAVHMQTYLYIFSFIETCIELTIALFRRTFAGSQS